MTVSPVRPAPAAPVPYYGGGTIGNLGRAKLDGSEADPNYIDVNPGVTDPTQQVEDSNPVASGGFVYYITGNGSVGRVGLDGSDLNNNWISGATYPGVESQLALDAQYIYVTNQNNGNGAIGRFNLTDGSQAGFGSTTGDQFISGREREPRSVEERTCDMCATVHGDRNPLLTHLPGLSVSVRQ